MMQMAGRGGVNGRSHLGCAFNNSMADIFDSGDKGIKAELWTWLVKKQ
jgi:hypothetical protein